MKQDNAAGFFRCASMAKTGLFVSTLFLFGCGHTVKKPIPPATPSTPAITGIAPCDAYLNTYLTCHRAAGTYPAEMLQTHYQAMRDTLLQEASDPGVRPYLASRCQGLTQQLHDALQGRACTDQASGSATAR